MGGTARQAVAPGAGQRLAMPGRYLSAAHQQSCKLDESPKGERMKHLVLSLGAVAVAVSTSLPAAASEELAKKHNCLACHTVDKKVVGPAYKEVAAQYRGRKTPEAKLFEKGQKDAVAD